MRKNNVAVIASAAKQSIFNDLSKTKWIASVASSLAKTIVIVLGLTMGLFSPIALSDSSPLPMLQDTSQRMLDELKRDKVRFKKEPALMSQVVRTILLPHVDVQTMSRMVLGRDAWLKASAAERQQFTDEFVKLLIRTYASALCDYNDQTVEFSPIRGELAGKPRVQVESRIVRGDGPPIPLSYRLVRQGENWKVYDFSVDGVSMIESFRSQFAAKLSQGSLAALLQELSEKSDSQICK